MAEETDLVTFSVGEHTNSNSNNLINNNNNNNNVDDDHTPHQLFCEMDEFNQTNSEWKEAARWLKFEEDVENGGRWSKPHVATLSLHSLFELRSCLVNGATLLDFQGDNLETIIGNCFYSLLKRVPLSLS